jgi:hypothetical protein
VELISPWAESAPGRRPPPATSEYRSLALPVVFRRLDRDRKYRILDLGQAYGVNVDFFSQFPCKLYVADLFRSLRSRLGEPTGQTEPAEEDESSRLSRIFTELLPYGNDTRFDLVLAWDLLNYLEPEQIEALSYRLNRFCQPGTMILAMIAIHREIPARPCGFRILDAETLEYDSPTHSTRPAPRHKEPELRRLMPGFQVDSTFLLRNGLLEYLFVSSGGG